MVDVEEFDLMEQSKFAITRSRKAAAKWNHVWITGEHLLFGIVTGQNTATNILQALKIEPNKVALEIEKMWVKRPKKPQKTYFSPSVWQILNIAQREAASFEIPEIATEHILLAIMRDKFRAQSMLAPFGISQARVEEAVRIVTGATRTKKYR